MNGSLKPILLALDNPIEVYISFRLFSSYLCTEKDYIRTKVPQFLNKQEV